MTRETLQLTHLRRLFVLLPVVLFLFAACSSAPSETEGKKFFEDKAARIEGLYKVQSFKKTNGISGQDNYRMDYEVDLECLDTGFQAGVISCKQIGQIVKRKGTLLFEKTENGWRVKDDQLGESYYVN